MSPSASGPARDARISLVILVVLLFAATPAFAQDADTVRADLAAALEESGASAEAVARFDVMARRVTGSMSADELARLAALPVAKRVRRVVARWRELRDADVRNFVASNPEAGELDRLERVRRAFRRKADAALEHTIDRAMAYGVLSDDDADELRALAGRARGHALRELAKDVFLAAWEDALPASDLERLRALDAHAFWRDPVVRRFRLAAALPAADRTSLRRVPARERPVLLAAVRAGRPLGGFVRRGVLSADLARRLEAIPRNKRERVARELQRIHFQREKRLAVPRAIYRRLDHAARRELRSMSTAQRLAWLKARFPGRDWDAYAEAFRRRRHLERVLERVPQEMRRRLLRQLERGERRRLQRMSPRQQLRFLRERFPAAPWPR